MSVDVLAVGVTVVCCAGDEVDYYGALCDKVYSIYF